MLSKPFCLSTSKDPLLDESIIMASVDEPKSSHWHITRMIRLRLPVVSWGPSYYIEERQSIDALGLERTILCKAS